MPCLCNSPERKSTSKTPKLTRPDRIGVAIVACVARELSTTVRPAGHWPLSEPQAPSFQVPAPSESFQRRASLHALTRSWHCARVSASREFPQAGPERKLRRKNYETNNDSDRCYCIRGWCVVPHVAFP